MQIVVFFIVSKFGCFVNLVYMNLWCLLSQHNTLLLEHYTMITDQALTANLQYFTC